MESLLNLPNLYKPIIWNTLFGFLKNSEYFTGAVGAVSLKPGRNIIQGIRDCMKTVLAIRRHLSTGITCPLSPTTCFPFF